MPKQWLADVADLQAFITAQLSGGLHVAIGQFLLNGSTDPAVEGVLGTTGVLVQAYATDVLTTCRSALTVLQQAGETPSGWVFNPTDWQTIEQQRDTQNRYLFGGGLPAQRPGQQLFYPSSWTSMSRRGPACSATGPRCNCSPAKVSPSTGPKPGTCSPTTRCSTAPRPASAWR